MSDGLPQGWANITLGEICSKPQYGWTCRGAKTGQVKYVRTTDISEGKIDWASVPYCEETPEDVEKYRVRSNDILVSRAGSVGVSFRITDVPCDAVFASYLIRFNALDEIEPKYVEFFLKSDGFWRAISEFTAGIAVPNVNASKLASLALPLAPFPEQRRIVAKLEKLLGKVDDCQKRLAKIPILLKRFRQSVLAAACSGRLTADWREQRPEVESASNLLAKIQERRMALAESKKEQAQISAAFEKQNLDPGDEELGFNDIPETWVACRVGAIGAVSNGSTPSRKRPEFWDGDIAWVSSGEVCNNVISETRECITKAGYEGSSVRLLPRGTVLLAMIGEGKTRGQSAILAIEATINQNIAAVVLEHRLVRSDYLWRWFQLQYEATRERGSGSGPQALNCQRVRELPFVLPPLVEQQEIVRRVEAFFALADQIEARFAKAQAHVDKLTSSLLAKAFRGELVPTEAELARAEKRDYEPASVLLERIRAARASEQVASTPSQSRAIRWPTAGRRA